MDMSNISNRYKTLECYNCYKKINGDYFKIMMIYDVITSQANVFS